MSTPVAKSHTYVRAVNNFTIAPRNQTMPAPDTASPSSTWKPNPLTNSNPRIINTSTLPAQTKPGKLSNGSLTPSLRPPSRLSSGSDITGPIRLVGPMQGFTQTLLTFELQGVRGREQYRTKVVNPRDKLVACVTSTNSRGVAVIEFKGDMPGMYTISALVDGQMVEGSPARCELQHISQVTCRLLQDAVLLGDTITLLVELSKNSLKLIGPNKPVMSSEANSARDGRQEACTVETVSTGKSSSSSTSGSQWKVLLRPQEAGLYEIRPKLNECLLPGSPFECSVVDMTKLQVTGPGLLCANVDRDTWFQVHLPEDAPEKHCQVSVVEPSTLSKSKSSTLKSQNSSKQHLGNNLNVCRSINNLAPTGGCELLCQFKPKFAGPHEVHVNYLERPVPGSPWICQVFNANGVKVVQRPPSDTVSVGETASYLVDCREGGRGDLSCMVNLRAYPETDISVNMRPENETQQLIRCEFPIQHEGEHLVHFTYNGLNVPGSPFHLLAKAVSEVVSPPLRSQELTSSTSNNTAVNKTYATQPMRVGTNSQLRVHNDPSQPMFGDEGRPDDIRLAVPSDGLTAVVKGPFQELLPHQIFFSPSQNSQLVEFSPRCVGEHQIDVYKHGVAVEGSPFYVRVYDPNKVKVTGARTIPVGIETKIHIDTREAGHVPFDVSVDPPPGCQDLDTHLQPLEGGFDVGYWIFGYIPQEPGVYRVHVFYGDMPIVGSPLEQYAQDGSVRQTFQDGSPRQTFQDGSPRQTIQEGSSRQTFQKPLSSSAGVKDKIAEGGWTGGHSPYTVTDATATAPRVYGEGLAKAMLGQKTRFNVDPNGQKGELFVQIEGPNSMAQCNIARDPSNPNAYFVEYIPTEVGHYVIHIHWQNQVVAGSPFDTLVVAPDEVRCISDPGVHFRQPIPLIYRQHRDLVFDCSKAGPGTLSAEVLDGDRLKVPVEVTRSSAGNTWTVSFMPITRGTHQVNVWWGGFRLPDCPFLGDVAASMESFEAVPSSPSMHYIQEQQQTDVTGTDPTKVILLGRGLRECVVGHPSEFIIDGTSAGVGRPRVTLTDSYGSEIPIRVSAQGRQLYLCSYMAEKPGHLLLNILWEERQVRGAPFTILVRREGSLSPSDSLSVASPSLIKSSKASPVTQGKPKARELLSPSKEPSGMASGINVWGPGLLEAVVHRPARVYLDVGQWMGTSRLPPNITAKCIGPRGMPAVCEVGSTDKEEVYEVAYTPQEPGTHELFLYCDNVVLRSCPYRINVAASASDPEKVRVYGPGVEWGVLEDFESRFICDTRGAGAGQLTVKIKGKQGAFRVELERENQHDRGIVCRYDPTEAGDYFIVVKWSGNPVPGSPFHVRIFETLAEYKRHMHSQPPQHNERNVGRGQHRNGWQDEL